MRIAYILRKFAKYSETFIGHEIAELIRRGHDVRIFTPTLLADPPVQPVVRHNQLLKRTVCFAGTGQDSPASVALSPALRARLWHLAAHPPPGVTRAAELDRLVRLTTGVRTFAPDHVHAHFATEATHYASVLKRILGVPFSLTAHGYDIYRKAPADFAARMADATDIVTVSEANRRAISSLHGVPEERIRVINCGVDLQAFRPGADPDPELILAVARLVPVKRLDVLLDACARLRDRRVRFRCVLVGEGEDRPRLKARRRELRLENRVDLVGAASQEAVRDWLERAAVVALTSEMEGMPVSLMEAAACGRPVVAPAVGGIPEVVVDGVTGLLVGSGDGAAIADALELLLGRPDLRRAMGRAARERAEAHFSLESQVDQLLELWTRREDPVPVS